MSAPLGLCDSRGDRSVRDVGVEQGLNVVNKGVFKVDSGRLQLEGDLGRRCTEMLLELFLSFL